MLKRKFPKFIYLLVCFVLIFQQSGFAQVAAELNIAGYLTTLHNSFVTDKFRPLHLRYLSYDSLNNNFKLLIDKGDTKNPATQELENASKELLKYFFIGLSLPNDSFWVNLRPDSPDNIIDDYLAKTDVGKIMLEADLQLKKDTALATSPETPKGRDYWNKLYSKAGELFGSENITIPTLTRPWIVPDEIIIRETPNTPSAYIYKATLKVMLESDYLNSTNSAIATNPAYQFKDERLKQLNEYSSQLIRELIIPKLTKEVNTSKRYAPLRQVYYSLILAQWFKARNQNKDNQYSRLINRRDLTNLISKEDWSKTTYFQAYQKSFTDGEYNIQEPVYTPTGQVIRSYFSGGMKLYCSIPAVVGAVTFIDPTTGAKITSSPATRDFDAEDKTHLVGMKIQATGSFGEIEPVSITPTAAVPVASLAQKEASVSSPAAETNRAPSIITKGTPEEEKKAREFLKVNLFNFSKFELNFKEIIRLYGYFLFKNLYVAAGTEAFSLFIYGIPAIKEFFGDDFKSYWPDLVRLGIAAGKNGDVLLKLGLSAVKELITDRESLNKIGDDLVRLAEFFSEFDLKPVA